MDIMSFRLVEYSRIRPQPVQVRLQVCKGSNCNTRANFGVRRTLCLMMCRAIFAVSASGNRIWNYWACATVIGNSCNTSMSLVEGAEFWINAGSKKVAGDTPYDVLMPLQPALRRHDPAKTTARPFAFQTNFTREL